MKQTKFRLLVSVMLVLICMGLLLVSCDSNSNEDDSSDDGATNESTSVSTGETVGSYEGTTGSSQGTTDPSQGTTDSSQGTTDPSQGTTDPSEGTTDPSEGTTDPSEGTTDPSEGTTDPSQGTTDPSEGTTDSSEGTTDSSEGTTDSSDGTTDPSEGTTDTSNNKPEDKPCTEHKGGTATCTKKAVCEACGEEYGDFGDHDYAVIDKQDATCSKAGYEKHKCSVCGDEKEEITESAKGHDGSTFVTSVVNNPTCTEDGFQKLICSECQEEMWQKDFVSTIPALGHTYVRGDSLFDEELGVTFVEGKCEVEGYFARVCKDCGFDQNPITREMYGNLQDEQDFDFDPEIYAKMQAKEHAFEELIDTTKPTCTEYGYNIYKCLNCEKQDKVISAIPDGHQYYKEDDAQEIEHYIVVTQPTCITTGKLAYVCVNCGEQSSDEEDSKEIAMLPHDTSKRDFEYLVVSCGATCESAAYEIYRCCNGACDVTETVTDPTGEALGHDWQRNGDPSCLTDGLTPYKCARPDCGMDKVVDDEYSIKDVRHVKESVVSAATCASDAVYLCAVCGFEYKAYDDDAEGVAHGMHNMVYLSTVAPTCASEGYNLYKCDGDPDCEVIGKNTDYTKLDQPMDADITPRTDHRFNLNEYNQVVLEADGSAACLECGTLYRDVNTEITVVEEKLCHGNCPSLEECTCDIILETKGYLSPDPIQLFPNQRETIEFIEWSGEALALGGGLIVLEGYEGVTYNVSIYDSNGDTLMNYYGEGATYYINLCNYEDVASVTVTASSYATLRLFTVVE